MYFKEEYLTKEDKSIKFTDVNKILNDKNILIVGDFWGIQKFIFEGLTTDKAAKVLRAKSAFVLIYMDILSQYLCKKFDLQKENIISLSAGKFEILMPKDKFDNVILNDIQKKIDEYFLTNFYGLSGVSLGFIEVDRDKFLNDYKSFREEVADTIEEIKFNKFNLDKSKAIQKYNENIDNQNLCPICNIRKKEKDECKICNSFIKLGKKLTYTKPQKVKNTEFQIFEDEDIEVKLYKNIKSYIPSIQISKDEREVLTLEEIAKNSCKNLDTGIKALGVLKADVDGMGNFIKNTDVTKRFENFDNFSKTMDGFFSGYVTDMLRGKIEKYKDRFRNIYTIFAGGDDLFLVGAWNEILDFAREIRKDFDDFQNNQGLSISFGIVVSKESVPIKYLAEISEENLEKAKDFCIKKDGDFKDKKEKDKLCKEEKEVYKKDALSLWDEIVRNDEYIKVWDKLDKVFSIDTIKDKKFDTTYLYRLLEICEMSKRVKYQKSIIDTMWKSKLNYISKEENEKEVLKVLDKCIKDYPKETKLFLVEYIYKRREQ